MSRAKTTLTRDVSSVIRNTFLPHCQLINASKIIPHWPLVYRPRSIRDPAHQETRENRRIQRPAMRRRRSRPPRAARQSLPLRDQSPRHHRRHTAQQCRALRQSLLQSERGNLYIRRACVHPRDAQHQAGRGNHLRLRQRLSQVRHRPLALPMHPLPASAGAQTAGKARTGQTPGRPPRPRAPRSQAAGEIARPRRRAGRQPSNPPIRFCPCPPLFARARQTQQFAGALLDLRKS